MKTLTDEVNDIIKSRSSKQVKSASLIKLGLCKHEVVMLLGAVKAVSNKKSFNANILTFGVEIECYNVVRDALIAQVQQRNISIQSQNYNHRDSKDSYKIVSDASICGANGEEVVSPILKGKKGENSLKSVCDSLNTIDAKVNKSTGLHVHFDASKISDLHFVNIFRNYAKLEKVIDSFMPISRRENNNCYCRSIRNYRFIAETKEELIRGLSSRYYKVNAQSYLRHKTVEFRQHSGTIDYTKIINWVNFLRKLITFSFDNDITECNTIEEIPFLTESEKAFFVERRNQLA